MEQNALKYYSIIGRVQNTVSQAQTLDEALRKGLKVIVDCSAADFGVICYKNTSDGRLHPYYWICPVDLTTVSFAEGEGVPGRVFGSGETVIAKEFSELPEPFAPYTEADVCSLCCVPFGDDDMCFGCVELMKKTESGAFTDEEADLCQLLVLMAGIALREKGGFAEDDYQQNVILSARGICRDFKNGDRISKVLKGVNLDVVEGELIVILGASGCGKSTFLNIIAGMDKATGGSFSFLGKDMTDATEEELTEYRRRNIGFIFQSYNLMPNLTAKQNLDLIGELVDDPMDSVEALKMVGLERQIDQYPSRLSGGQQQRISIARALVKKPRIIFADEPTAALDYKTSIEVLTVLENIVKQGTTLLMVTHNEEITRMANRVIRMRNGMTYEVTVNRFPVKATELVW